jgi:hypothetical protein
MPAQSGGRGAAKAPQTEHCTLDSKGKVEAVVVAALQIRYPHIPIKPSTKLDDDLGMDEEARAAILPGWMREATRRGGCETRLGSNAYRRTKTVQDIIDAIWNDLQKKCNL